MNSQGCRWKPSEKGVGSRLAGINAIHGWLAIRRDGLPWADRVSDLPEPDSDIAIACLFAQQSRGYRWLVRAPRG
jgi:hypothetical protein